MKKYYLKIIKRECPICNSQAETIGYFKKNRLRKVSGIDCQCGNKEKNDFFIEKSKLLELNPKYIEIAKQRIRNQQPPLL